MKRLELNVFGEKWVSYPIRMRFPKFFYKAYPHRGRGYVAKALYWLNYLHLDAFCLRRANGLDGLEDVALFWPSKKRSTGRGYGYRVKDGKVVEYLKFATTDDEKHRLMKEAENVKIVRSIPNRCFEVPRFIGIEERDGELFARYEALPSDACGLIYSNEWMARVEQARKQIAAAGYSHGDFSGHNIKIVGERLWIIDWEEMRTGVSPLVDQIVFDGCRAVFREGRTIDDYLDSLDLNKCIAAIMDIANRSISPGRIMLESLRRRGLVK